MNLQDKPFKKEGTFKVGLFDYVQKGAPVEVIELPKVIGKTRANILKDKVKQMYGGKCYTEIHNAPNQDNAILIMAFSPESDFFLMVKLLKQD